MSASMRLHGVRSARLRNVAAKVGDLRGSASNDERFPGYQLQLHGMHIMCASRIGWVRVVAVAVEGGHALCLQVSHGPRVWLIAEKSKRVRVFKTLEALLATARILDAEQVVVELQAFSDAIAQG